MNTAVIVAAGSGTRFRSDKPKQYLELAGKPVIVHTLERFEACEAIDSIVVVMAEEHESEFAAITAKYSFAKLHRAVTGGRTRAESVKNGLSAVDEATEIVAVHDGARPLVIPEDIERTVKSAVENGAACLVGPVTDTIKKIEGDQIAGTIDRRDLRRALTPQAFRLGLLLKAFENAPTDEAVSDECYLVERLGERISAISGNPYNLKITHKADLIFAEALLKAGVV